MQKYLDSLSIPSISSFSLGPGMLFGVLALIFILLYGLSLGRTRALVSLLAIYIAYSIQSVFPYLDRLHELVNISPQLYVTRVALFLLIYIIVFMILNRSVVKSRLTLKDASFFSVSIISLLQLIILVTVIANIVPLSALRLNGKVPGDLVQYFATQDALFYWFLAPIAALLFMRGEKS